jgi:hypothetical protein
MSLRRGTSRPALLAACSAAAIAAASGSAMAAPPPNCPTQTGTGTGFIPVQTIQIFNDSTYLNIFAELEVGLNEERDLWMQDICNVPDANKDTLYPYPTTVTNRMYINGLAGIPPGGSVTITLPLFTQLVATVDPTQPNQYAEWWQGQNLQIFGHPSNVTTPPRSFANYFNGTAPTRPKGSQAPTEFNSSNPTKPTCTAGGTLNSCTLTFVTDTAGTLGKFGPSQLLEATLGANQGKVPAPTDGSIKTFLYPTQADFDVSYVNVAYLGAAMGPVGNDQAGYVGTPLRPGDFIPTLNTFQSLNKWPQFIDLDGSKAAISKLPSPLELFARLSGKDAPTDITPLTPPQKWPTNVWTPIQALKTNWTTYGGPAPKCTHSANGYTTFCDAILDVKALIHDNYEQYVTLMTNGTCTGGPSQIVPEDDFRTIAHVYGWTPWTESVSGKKGVGCRPKDNLLENTPGYKENDYEKYGKVKTEFDNLNYGGPSGAWPSPGAPYVFNPWVEFIHGVPPGTANPKLGYLGMPGVYAYSVDDAVGNLNVNATGYIVDIADTTHLENQTPAGPPINISLGYAYNAPVRFLSYSVCGPNKNKPVNPAFPSFIISAINPQTCPVWLQDNKGTNYTFTIEPTSKPPNSLFTLIPTSAVKAGQAGWSTGFGFPAAGKNNPTAYNTAGIIDCSGNPSTTPPSIAQLWCCTRLPPNLQGQGVGNGVSAYSTPPSPPLGHVLYENFVGTSPATDMQNTTLTACSKGMPGTPNPPPAQ